MSEWDIQSAHAHVFGSCCQHVPSWNKAAARLQEVGHSSLWPDDVSPSSVCFGSQSSVSSAFRDSTANWRFPKKYLCICVTNQDSKVTANLQPAFAAESGCIPFCFSLCFFTSELATFELWLRKTGQTPLLLPSSYTTSHGGNRCFTTFLLENLNATFLCLSDSWPENFTLTM